MEELKKYSPQFIAFCRVNGFEDETQIFIANEVWEDRQEVIDKLQSENARLREAIEQANKDIKSEHECSVRKCLSEGGKGMNDYVDGRMWATEQCVKHIEYHYKKALKKEEI